MSAAVFAGFMLLALFGLPIAFAMGSAALAALAYSGVDFSMVPQRMMHAVNSFPLMSIPFFMLAGELMIKAGIVERLIALANAVVGRVRGGMAHVTMLSGAGLATVSGAASAASPRERTNQSHVEVFAGTTHAVSDSVQVIAGAGLGVERGFGAPDWRVVSGIRYTPAAKKTAAKSSLRRIAEESLPPLPAKPIVLDSDGDGILDTDDACIDEPGPAANHGCPESDRDHDTVIDRLDSCIDEPGTVANHG